jgi:hypothetical protein
MKTLWIKGDRIIALVLTIFSGNLFLTSLRYGLFLEDGAPGPGLFPAIITAPLTLLSAGWLVIGNKDAGTKVATGPKDEIEELAQELEANAEALREIDGEGKKRIAWVIAWSLVFIFAFERIGAILTMILFSIGVMWSIDRRKPWRTLPLAVILVLLIVFGAKSIGVTLPDPFNLYRIYGGL